MTADPIPLRNRQLAEQLKPLRDDQRKDEQAERELREALYREEEERKAANRVALQRVRDALRGGPRS
jgi:hypothetical protein